MAPCTYKSTLHDLRLLSMCHRALGYGTPYTLHWTRQCWLHRLATPTGSTLSNDALTCNFWYLYSRRSQMCLHHNIVTIIWMLMRDHLSETIKTSTINTTDCIWIIETELSFFVLFAQIHHKGSLFVIQRDSIQQEIPVDSLIYRIVVFLDILCMFSVYCIRLFHVVLSVQFGIANF